MATKAEAYCQKCETWIPFTFDTREGRAPDRHAANIASVNNRTVTAGSGEAWLVEQGDIVKSCRGSFGGLYGHSLVEFRVP